MLEFRPTGNPTLDFLQTFENQRLLAVAIARAGITPHKTPEAVLTVALAAQELGIGTMMACQNTHVIEGKLGYSADLLMGLAIQRAGVRFSDLKVTKEKVTGVLHRDGWEPIPWEYTYEQAKTAGLASKKNWVANPTAMMVARWKSSGVRVIAPPRSPRPAWRPWRT
jgi:hypothetical protein